MFSNLLAFPFLIIFATPDYHYLFLFWIWEFRVSGYMAHIYILLVSTLIDWPPYFCVLRIRVTDASVVGLVEHVRSSKTEGICFLRGFGFDI